MYLTRVTFLDVCRRQPPPPPSSAVSLPFASIFDAIATFEPFTRFVHVKGRRFSLAVRSFRFAFSRRLISSRPYGSHRASRNYPLRRRRRRRGHWSTVFEAARSRRLTPRILRHTARYKYGAWMYDEPLVEGRQNSWIQLGQHDRGRAAPFPSEGVDGVGEGNDSTMQNSIGRKTSSTSCTASSSFLIKDILGERESSTSLGKSKIKFFNQFSKR